MSKHYQIKSKDATIELLTDALTCKQALSEVAVNSDPSNPVTYEVTPFNVVYLDANKTERYYGTTEVITI